MLIVMPYEDENNDLRPGSGKADEHEFSIEEIMAEYKSDIVLGSGRAAKGPKSVKEPKSTKNDAENSMSYGQESFFPDIPPLEEEETGLFSKNISTVKYNTASGTPGKDDVSGNVSGEYAAQAETNNTLPLSQIADNENFKKYFAPSDTFVGDEINKEQSKGYDGKPDIIEEDGEEKSAGKAKRLKKKKRSADDEEKKSQIAPGEAYIRMNAYVKNMGLRTLVAAILCLPQLYIIFAPRMGLWLPGFLDYIISYRSYLFISIILLVVVMFLSLDVVAIGIKGLARLRPGAESMVTLACFMGVIHAGSILLFPKWGGYMPYCAVNSVAMFFSMWGLYLKQAALRTTYKSAASSGDPYIVYKEDNIFEEKPGYMKSSGNAECFVAVCESEDGAERIYSYLAPMLIIAGIVFAVIASFGKGESRRFIWALSAILTGSTPFSMLLVLNLPFSIAAHRITRCGAALAGFFGIRTLSGKNAVIIGDTDLFPPGTIFLNGLKLFGNYAIERVVSYAASAVTASGCGLTKVFTELLNEQSGALRKVENFCHYEGGGVGAYINGDRVLVGTSDFLIRMGIQIPRGVNMKNAVLISINLELAGVFAINYSPSRSVKYMIHTLLRHKMTIVLASLDFNITPSLIKQKFKLNADEIEYPPIEDRIRYSDNERKIFSKPGAVLSREGLVPFGEAVTSARRCAKAYNGNMFFSIACAIIGILLMFFMAYIFSPGSASPVNVMLFLLLWTAPPLLISGWVNRY